MNSTGALAIIFWIVIAVSQLRSRKVMLRQGVDVTTSPGIIRMWGFPAVTWIVIVALTALLIYMFFAGEQRLLVVMTTAVVAAIAVVAGIIVHFRTRNRTTNNQAD